MKRIKFTAQGANSVLGGFQSGDIARVDDAFAAHLVNEARVAVYLETLPVESESIQPRARKQKASKK